MTGPLETTFVEIDANTKPLEEGVDKASEKTTKKLKTDFEKATAAIEATLKRASKSIQRNLDKIAESGDVTALEIEAAMTHAARAITDEYQQMARHVDAAFDKVTRSAVESAVVSEAAVTLSENLSEVQTQVSGLAAGLQKLGGALGSAGPGMLILVGAVLLLLPAVIALAAALTELIGLVGILPAGIGLLVTAIIPLVVAFQNFGDALSAIASGDVKKINEALKKLSPSARAVAREFEKLQPVFKSFQRSVQENFFQPLKGDLTLIVTKLFPTLRRGFGNIASAFGELTDKFLVFLSKPAQVKAIGQLLQTTTRFIRGFMDAGTALFKGFLDAANAMGPTLVKLGGAISNIVKTFGEWLSRVSKSGQLKKWFDDGLRVAGELWELLKSLGRLLGTIFGSFETSGEDVIQTLTDVINKMNEFFKSAEGQKALERAVKAVKAFNDALEFAVGAIIFFDEKGTQLVTAIKNIVTWADNLYQAFYGGIAAALNAVGEGVVAIIGWFGSIIPKIGGFLTKLPGYVVGFFKTMADGVLVQIGIWLGLIIAAVTRLPGMIVNAVQALPGMLATFFTGVWDQAKSITLTGIDAVVGFVKSLPGRVIAFTKSAAGAIADFFSRIFTGGKERAKSAVDSIIGFVRNLPSKLTAFVKNIGGEIANAIKGMLNHAISKINEGLAKVDKFIPGDLPRIPQLAQGAVIKASPGGTLVNVGEGGKDEVVGPLDDVARILGVNGNGGTNVNFAAGAIVIEFHGVTPTQGEARKTGEAVAAGLASKLGPRDARTRVRTL